jgi:hypothetical protein
VWVFRWSCAVAVGSVLSGFAYLLVTGEYANDGPVLLQVAADHGLHRGDVFVLAGWVIAMALLVVLARTRGRPSGERRPEQEVGTARSG